MPQRPVSGRAPRIAWYVARALPFAYLQAVPVEILTGMRTPMEALAAAARAWTWALGMTRAERQTLLASLRPARLTYGPVAGR